MQPIQNRVKLTVETSETDPSSSSWNIMTRGTASFSSQTRQTEVYNSKNKAKQRITMSCLGCRGIDKYTQQI